jgi:hypothetical protein
MRGYVAPLVLGIAATAYIAATGVVKVATIGTAATATGAAGGAGAAAAGPRQFLGVAASSVALAAAMVVGLTAGGESPEIPAAAPVPTQEAPPPESNPPQQQNPQQQQPPAQNPPPQNPPADEPPAQEQPPGENPPPEEPPAQPGPPQLDATGPAAPVSLIAGGAPVDLPLTVRNTGGTVSEPVTAVLNLPAGVTAIPVDGFAAPRLLNLNGARKAGTVNCPGGTGTVTCTDGGLQPGESVTLLFRLRAGAGSTGGQITGLVSAGTTVRVNVSVRVDVQPEETTDMVLLSVSVKTDVFGLFGLWVRPVVEVTVTNTGTSSRPVTLHLDQQAKVRWSSQELACSVGGGTTCTTPAELAPGEKLKAVLEIHADPWPEHQPGRDQLAVSVTLGQASDSESVTLRQWLCPPTPPAPPTEPTKPSTPSNPSNTSPPSSENPTHQPSTAPSPTGEPTDDPTTTTPPGTTTTTPPTSTTTPKPPDRSEPTPPENGQGGLGGLLGWLLGG